MCFSTHKPYYYHRISGRFCWFPWKIYGTIHWLSMGKCKIFHGDRTPSIKLTWSKLELKFWECLIWKSNYLTRPNPDLQFNPWKSMCTAFVKPDNFGFFQKMTLNIMGFGLGYYRLPNKRTRYVYWFQVIFLGGTLLFGGGTFINFGPCCMTADYLSKCHLNEVA